MLLFNIILMSNKSAKCEVRFRLKSPPVRQLFFSQKKTKSIGTLSVANRISHFAPNKKRPPICLFLFIFCFFVGGGLRTLFYLLVTL
jgi:hypothetical protein